MARYFFHLENGDPHCDAEGLDFPTDLAAELEAVRFLGELLAQGPEAFCLTQRLTLTVTVADRVAFALQARVVRTATP